MAEKSKMTPHILNAVLTVNQQARERFAERAIQMLGGDLTGKVVGVWGLSFKPDTDDMRESPSLDIIDALSKAGARVQAYDPIAMDVSRELLDKVAFCSDAYEAAKGADALLLVTAWNEFKQLDMERVRGQMRQPLLLDGRNIYDPIEMRELGFTYAGVGRA
jgi:UDPglucose 6-dehydrogenase